MTKDDNGQKVSIHLESSPSEEDDSVVRNGLQRFNYSITRTREIHYSVFAKNNLEEIIGGALVYIGRDSAFLDIFWVHKHYRKKGIGRSLLAAVEKHAGDVKGCEWVKLDTFSFQAPDFYLKCGYELYGEVKNFTNEDSKIFFRKSVSISSG